MINGIRFRVRTGVPWRDVPVEYGPWGRVHGSSAAASSAAVPSLAIRQTRGPLRDDRPSRGPSANGGDHSGSALHADQLIPLVP
ncbi:transposase [Streptomyces sp. NBC_01693]|uniref:transposase n=1 Tax=unclassified Streptomyces TaxID=2593676 RepID=UPI002E37FEF2|nr:MULTISPECIES: transposase [unclassified Streptomyces]WSS73834.1 transposase [Streptomyces sp. NBC_01174]WSS80758.1 transposase [Streptomyces sp. NBC_01174]